MSAEDRFLDFISDCCEKNLDLLKVGQTEKYKQLKKEYEDEKQISKMWGKSDNPHPRDNNKQFGWVEP